MISEAALRVLYRLLHAGYEAYLVGGGVRDLLLGREPKDFDVATNARPEQVRELFRNCRLVGRRFLLAHIQFGHDIVEVATFRASHDLAGKGEEGVMDEGRILRDNVYGSTIEQDAWRRDFTVNALYYNPRDFSVIAFGSGLDDLRSGVLRLVGEPTNRYREDPVRMLRAARFAAKLGFHIAPETEAPLLHQRHLLREVPPARLFDEALKLFMGGHALETFTLLRYYGLFGELFPLTEATLADTKNPRALALLEHALKNTDARVIADKPVAPAFLFAALLWEPVYQEIRRHPKMPFQESLRLAADRILQDQVDHVAVPRRHTLQVREIWALQGRLAQLRSKRHTLLLDHPRFRAAYDFLLLRAASGEDVQDIADHWTHLQEEAAAEGPSHSKHPVTTDTEDSASDEVDTAADTADLTPDTSPDEEIAPSPRSKPRRRRYKLARRKTSS